MSTLPIQSTIEEERTIHRAIKLSKRRRDYDLAKSLRQNWGPLTMPPPSETSALSDFVSKAIMSDSHSPTTSTALQEPSASTSGDGSKTISTAATPSGVKSPSSEELKTFRKKCAILEKERVDKDQLIQALLKELEGEREAHESLKRGVEGLGKELDFVDKLVYTMDDELSAVYDLLARSTVA